MPRGNGTGPEGLGPMTGRGAGYCAGFGMAGCGRGLGRGLGARRGPGGGFGPGLSRSLDAQSPEVSVRRGLELRADFLEEELSLVRGRLSALDSGAGEVRE